MGIRCGKQVPYYRKCGERCRRVDYAVQKGLPCGVLPFFTVSHRLPDQFSSPGYWSFQNTQFLFRCSQTGLAFQFGMKEQRE
jgi:hypothetical protein